MIRGTKTPLNAKAGVNIDVRANLHNRFDIEVIDARSGEVRQRAQAENVICNGLWTKLLSSSPWYFTTIQYGTGSGTPAATDTSLFTFLGYGTPAVADDTYAWGADLKSRSITRKIVLSESVAVGSTLTEVGIGSSSSASSLCTHAMIRDMNGNQISINKTNTDIINIYATVFIHWVDDAHAGSIGILHTDYIFTSLFGIQKDTPYGFPNRHLATAYGGFGYTEAFVSDRDTTTGNGGTVTLTSNASAKTLTFTCSRATVGQSNVGGIRKIFLGGQYGNFSSNTYGLYDYYSSLLLRVGGAWYPGTTITAEAIGTGDGATKDFRTAFPLVTNAAIYLDGLAQTSGVTVDNNVPGNLTDFGYEFNCIDASGNLILGYLPGGGRKKAGTYYYENPHWENVGISAVQTSTIYVNTSNPECRAYLWVSDDLTTWTEIPLGTTAQTVAIPEQNQHSRYFKVTATGSGLVYVATVHFVATAIADNIHFDAPPAEGVVITADYFTKTIAKDANHVFDLTVTLQFGEYTT